MLVDISHVSPAVMHAALNVSTAPVRFRAVSSLDVHLALCVSVKVRMT
jgi:hypothetical protein